MTAPPPRDVSWPVYAHPRRLDSADRGRARTLEIILTVSAAGLLLVGVAGRFGDTWWVFGLVANLPLQSTVALLVVLAGALLARRWLATGIAALGLALNLVVLWPVVAMSEFSRPAAALPGAEELTVTFFNTKIIGADRAATIAELADRDDDLVVLAGAIPAWVEELEDAEHLGLRVAHGPAGPDDPDLTALTRGGDVEVIVHRPTDDTRDALIELVVDLDGQAVHVLATHPVSPLTRQRAARRDATLAWIQTWARQRDTPVVVLGDLNATPWSPPFRELLQEGGLVDSQRGHGLQPSYPANLRLLGLPIDHVLHSPELTTLQRDLGPSFGSDHRMVHATLTRSAR